MAEKNKDKDNEWEMLGHDPVPGYKTALWVAVAVAVIYLAYAFSLGTGPAGH